MKSMLACVAAAAVLSAAPMAQSQPAAAQPLPPEGTPATTPWPLTEARARESALPWARIEQTQRGNRIVELRITNAAGDTRYTMINREGQPPRSTQELSSGLSTPRFFTFEF